MKTALSFDFGWFDGVAIATIIAGILIGRKRGMSAELLDLFQWLLMVVLAGYSYKPLGKWLNSHSVFSLLFCYVSAYLATIIAVKAVFMVVKRAIGGKLAGSDVFGRSEYYLGMVSGALRFISILIIILSLAHARLYSPAELQAMAKMQKENYGDISFPTGGSLQADIFKESMIGRFTDSHLSNMLIEPTAPAAKSLREQEGPAKKTDRIIDEFSNGKKKAK